MSVVILMRQSINATGLCRLNFNLTTHSSCCLSTFYRDKNFTAHMNKTSLTNIHQRHFSVLEHYRHTKPVLSNANLHGYIVDQNRSFVDYLSTCKATTTMQSVLEGTHDMIGLPWWATIVSVAVVLKLLMFPLVVERERSIMKRARVSSQFQAIKDRLDFDLRRHTQNNPLLRDKAKQVKFSEFKRIEREMYKKHNCHPIRGFLLVLIQLPVWVATSFATRNLCGSVSFANSGVPMAPSLADEGLLWVPDLLVPDAFLILPVILAIAALSNVKFFGAQIHRFTAMTGVALPRNIIWKLRVQNGIMYCLMFVFASISCVQPAALVLYWATSNVMSSIQNVIIFHPAVRRYFNIPMLEVEEHTRVSTLIADLFVPMFLRSTEKLPTPTRPPQKSKYSPTPPTSDVAKKPQKYRKDAKT